MRRELQTTKPYNFKLFQFAYQIAYLDFRASRSGAGIALMNKSKSVMNDLYPMSV